MYAKLSVDGLKMRLGTISRANFTTIRTLWILASITYWLGAWPVLLDDAVSNARVLDGTMNKEVTGKVGMAPLA